MTKRTWNKAWYVTLGAACLGLMACSSDSGAPTPSEDPSVVPSGEQEPLPPNTLEVGRWRGEWISATQELKFTFLEPEQPSGLESGMRPMGFAQVASNTMTFSTNWATIGSGGGAYDCLSTQLCASVTVQNDTSRALGTVYVEIDSLSPTGYEAVNSVTPPPGYPLSNARGLWLYDTLTPGGGTARTWKFGLAGTADFTFNVRVLATFNRNSYNVSSFPIPDTSNGGAAPWDDDVPVWRDACGAALSLPAYVTMDFPFTLYDWTFSTSYGEMSISPFGMGVFDVSGPPTLPLADPPLPDPNQVYNIFPFWEDLTNATVCRATEGTAPNRRFIVTWKDAQIVGFPETNMTFSTVLREGSDDIYFLFHRWSAVTNFCTALSTPAALRSRGINAVAGIQGDGTATNVSKPFSSGGIPVLLPFHNSSCPGAGYGFRLTASPVNNQF